MGYTKNELEKFVKPSTKPCQMLLKFSTLVQYWSADGAEPTARTTGVTGVLKWQCSAECPVF